MDTQELSLEELVRQQAAVIARLEGELKDAKPGAPADRLASLDINDVKVPYVFKKFPLTLYKRNKKRDNELDHPGYDTLLVGSERELANARKNGWLLEHKPLDPDNAPVAEPVAPAAKKAADK